MQFYKINNAYVKCSRGLQGHMLEKQEMKETAQWDVFGFI